MPVKLGSDSVEVDPENDPIRSVSRRVPVPKTVVASAANAAHASKKSVRTLTLAERLLLDQKVSDGQRVEVSSPNSRNPCVALYFVFVFECFPSVFGFSNTLLLDF
jgi:hypothetical protein